MNSDLKPRVTGTIHTLPFDKLSAEAFERLTLWLVRREGFERVQHLGEAGSEQGRDILAWKEGKRFAFQCKRVKAFSAAGGEEEIRKLRGLDTNEQPQEVVFVLPIALRAATRKAIWKAWGDEATCHFWVGNELDERAKRFPDLVEEFFQIPVEGAKPSLSEAVSGVTSIPNPPVHYLAREEALAALRAKLLAPGSARLGITSPRQAVGVQGMGGIGKSVLAAAVAQEGEVKTAFPDGVFWVAVGQQPDLRRLQIELAMAAGEARPIIESVHQGKLQLSRLLAERRVLMVLDDLWNLDDAAAFNVLGPRGRLLVTTRHSDLLVGLGAEEFRVELLAPDAALALLAKWAGEEVDRLPVQATKVARRCGYLPLALAMIGAMVRLRPTAWSDALERLDHADLGKIRRNFHDYPYPDLLRALAVSVETLPPEERERYLELAVFPEETLIPEATLETLWASSGLSAPDARDLAAKLVARSLAQPAGESLLRVHDLQADYLRHEVGDLRPLHLRLVAAYSARCPRGFASGPNDGYYFQNLAYHLVRAGRTEDLRERLLDYAWIEAKLTATNVNALLADYDALPDDLELRLVQEALRLSAHVLAEHPEELLGQLLGRLLGRQEPGIVPLLANARPLHGRPWLRPLFRCLIAPGQGMVRTLTGHLDWVRALAVLPDGRVISASNDNTLRIWDAGSGETLRTIDGHSHGHSHVVTALAVLPNGRLISASLDNTLKIWDVSSGEMLRTLEGHSSPAYSLAVLPDGRVVSASDDHTLRVWEVGSGKTLRIMKGHSAWVTALAVLPNGRLTSASLDHTLRVWDVGLGETLNTLEGLSGSVTTLAVLPNGRVISASDDYTLRVWDVGSGETIRIPEGHSGAVTGLAVLPDGRVLSTSDDHTLRVWDIGTGETVRTLEGYSGGVTALAVLPDGRVVSASNDDTLRVWDISTGETPKTLEGHSNWVTALAVLPDGRVVSASWDHTLRLWDVGTGETLKTLEGHSDWVTALAVLRDGRVVSASDDYTLRVWDVGTGKTLRTLKGHSAVSWLAVLPDGRVVSACWDHTLRVWDVDSGKTLKTLKGHTDRVTALAVLRDGLVISGSFDHTLRVWDVGSGSTVAGYTLDVLPDALASLGGRDFVAVGSGSGRLHFFRLEGTC